jgi:probable rRNA maturation factor
VGGVQRLYRSPWRIDVVSRPGVQRLIPAARLADVMAAALGAARASAPASIGLVLSDDVELAELNVRHMGTTGPTDVLSFPLLEPSNAGHSPSGPTFVLPPGRRPHLGDVIVSVERAIDQATTGRGGQTGDVKASPAEELRLLVVHGTLHICGWDHATPHEEAAMRTLERRILEALGGAGA